MKHRETTSGPLDVLENSPTRISLLIFFLENTLMKMPAIVGLVARNRRVLTSTRHINQQTGPFFWRSWETINAKAKVRGT